MFKLKSLFRRGTGNSHNSNSSERNADGGSSSKSSKNSSSNNNKTKSQSTTSLNSQTTNDHLNDNHSLKGGNQVTTTTAGGIITPGSNETLGSSSQFYTPTINETISERAVDVGDDLYQTQHHHHQQHHHQQQQQKYSTTPTTTKQQTIGDSTTANNLNQKKSKIKGQKQPKQLPLPSSIGNQQTTTIHSNQQEHLLHQFQALQHPQHLQQPHSYSQAKQPPPQQQQQTHYDLNDNNNLIQTSNGGSLAVGSSSSPSSSSTNVPGGVVSSSVSATASSSVNLDVIQNLSPANVMTSIALSPGTQNSSVSKATTITTKSATAPQLLLSSSAVANNNYTLQAIDSAANLQHLHQQQHHLLHQHPHQHPQKQQLHSGSSISSSSHHPSLHHNQNVQLDSNDLYKLNTAIAAAAVASNFHHHQQQQQQQLLNSAEQQFQQHQQQLLEANTKMQELQTKLDRLGHEKTLLESRISDLIPYQNEVVQLKAELVKMQNQQERNQIEIVNLKYENETLRNRLRDVVNSPLSDAEKHQIIQDSQRLHSSAPASIALPNMSDNGGSSGDMMASANAGNTSLGGGGGVGIGIGGSVTTPCLTPDWDKHSSSSEISVACLQDKIIQMEETHYSTNEELQATLQELADLQSQLSDAQNENERLTDEKDVLFQSLCRQTEKLNESRSQITNLQELLIRDAKQAEIGNSEHEKKLMDLIKSSQEEREAVLIKQEELNSELNELKQSLDTSSQENKRYKDRIGLLESTVETTTAEKKQIDLDLQQAKDDVSQRDIEINRLTTLLENARSKIEELEQDLTRGEKTDLSELLDTARKEKDTLEEKTAELQDQLSRSQADIRRLREQLSGLQEECKVAKNNAKCDISHLQYRLEQMQNEKDKMQADYQQLVETSNELQVQCKCHLEDKTQLQGLLNETQKHLSDVESKLNDTEEQLNKQIQLHKQEAEEWEQFQSDLLMTVRVANDFKTEALSEREQLVIDNKTQKEKIRMLEQQIEKLSKQNVQQNETQQSVLSSVQQEVVATRRNKIGSFNRQDSRLSVKTLIETIENNKQQNKTDDNLSMDARYSTSSPELLSDLTTNMPNMPSTNNITNATTTTTSINDWTDNIRLSSTDTTTTMTTPTITSHISINNNNSNSNNNNNININTKAPLREQQQHQPQQTSSIVSNLHHIGSTTNNTNLLTKSFLGAERKDPLNMLVKNGGSKRNALLKWCQNKTVGYRNIDITNFSSSWNDGLAFCAILHSYLSDRIPYDTLTPANKRRNFSLAFAAAESVGIPTTLNINDMCQLERPDWTQVMTYVTAIYKHFET